MQIHEAGRETSHLNDIVSGKKVVEGRLAKGKFLNFKVGDLIKLREDIYENGVEVKTIHNRLTTKITDIKHFSTFREMLEKIDYQKALPRASSVDDAVNEYAKYYSSEDEKKFGVIAIYFEVVSSKE
jgi:ASC-1-like (ASCH) protein